MTASCELPEGWVPIDLSEVGELYCGQSPSRSEVNHDGNGTLYVTGPEQWDGHHIVEDKWTTNPKRVVPDGCIFITVKGAGVGKLFPGVACAIGRDVYAYKPHSEIPMDFVRLALKHSIEDLKRQAVGDIPGLSKRHILGHPIGFPPLNEQRRIVAKIEELTARSRNAKQALDAIPPLLERFHQSVLAAAFRGDLTKQWRQQNPNTEPATELLKRIRQERRHRWEQDYLQTQKAKGKQPKNDKWKQKYQEPEPVDTTDLPELPEGWCWAAAEEVTEFITDGTHQSPPFASEGIPFLVISNVKGRSIDWDSVGKWVTAETFKDYVGKAKAQEGDVLYTAVGSYGTAVPVEESRIFMFQRHIAHLRPFEGLLNFRYFAHLLNSPIVLRQAHLNARGNAQKTVTLGSIRRFFIPVCPVEEQIEIDKRLSEVLGTKELISHSTVLASERNERLNQSILAKAFRGELVPQDPNDEPASTLLDRVRTDQNGS